MTRSGISSDGRHIDETVGALGGEGAQQRIKTPDPHPDRSRQVWQQQASESPVEEPTYFDQPMIMEPVWIWSVPAYFYVGGVAGAASMLAAAVQALNREYMRSLIVRCRWLATVNALVGTVFLIYDLGRPERFLNMLRVFRITSPMSVGSWILALFGGVAASAALLANTKGPFRRLGDWAGYVAGLLGLPLAGYTAVLIANTAVPLWQASRKHLPFLFIGSAISSAASILKFLPFSDAEENTVNTYYIAGLVTELVADVTLERAAGEVDPVGRPLHEGLGGTLLTTARILSVVGLLLALLPRRSRAKRFAEGALGTLSSILIRFGIFYAGKASARDPRASFRQQRHGRGAAEVTGQAAVTAAHGKRATSVTAD